MTALPRDLESQIIGAKLRDLLGQFEASSPFANFIKSLPQITESVTAQQEKVFNNIRLSANNNEKETDKVMSDGIKNIENNKEKVQDELNDGSKLFIRNAPEDATQRFQLATPKSP